MILIYTRFGKHWDSSEHVAVKAKIEVQLLCRLPGCHTVPRMKCEVRTWISKFQFYYSLGVWPWASHLNRRVSWLTKWEHTIHRAAEGLKLGKLCFRTSTGKSTHKPFSHLPHHLHVYYRLVHTDRFEKCKQFPHGIPQFSLLQVISPFSQAVYLYFFTGAYFYFVLYLFILFYTYHDISPQ